MKTISGKIRTELVYGILLLSFVSIIITFLATFKIIEKNQVEMGTFKLQKIIADIRDNPPADLRTMKVLMPQDITFSIHDLFSGARMAGNEILPPEEAKNNFSGTLIEKRFLYPEITMIQPVNIQGRSYTLIVKKDFDAERNSLAKVFYLFLPFALISLITLTGFAYGFYRKRLLEPFEMLQQAYAGVSGNSMDIRVRPVNIREWDMFFEQFNLMMDRLNSYKNKLQNTIAELSNTNQALRSAQNEIVFSEKMATVGRLAAGLAHEIGNPLTSIMGYLSHMIQNAKTGEDKEMLGMMLNETERINRIIKELLQFARTKPDIGAFALCNPRDVMEDTIRLLMPQKEFGRVTLINEIRDTVPVSFNSDELKQVFLNLIINAMDVTPEHGRITVRSRQDEQFLIVSVVDEGGGIPDEIRDKIFEPFFTTKPPGRGTGLGLSVVHSLVMKYGGRIEYENAGNGTTFYLKLKKAEI